MPAQIIDGKAVAEEIRKSVAGGVAEMKRTHGVVPGLAVVLVGEDPASQVYVRNKGREADRRRLPLRASTRSPPPPPEDDLLELIGEAECRADDVHGILVQLPLPKHIDPRKVIEAIDPAKDVDGFHPDQRRAAGDRRRLLCPAPPPAASFSRSERCRSSPAAARW
jgi:methylenetetrahydrofolate dehydrogenase (NADP+)/methenyltetrahydrofolate cyclohydrolase